MPMRTRLKLIVDGRVLKERLEQDELFIDIVNNHGFYSQIIVFGGTIINHVLGTPRFQNKFWTTSFNGSTELLNKYRTSLLMIPVILNQKSIFVPPKIDITTSSLNVKESNEIAELLDIFEYGFPITLETLKDLIRKKFTTQHKEYVRYVSILANAMQHGIINSARERLLVENMLQFVQPKHLANIQNYNFRYDLSMFPNTIIRIE